MKTIIILMLFTALNFNIFSQDNNPKGFECNLGYSSSVSWDPNYIGGQWKPESIERYTSEPDAVFPVLVVFVQYKNDPGPDVSHWHPNQAPSYINDVISLTKKTSVNWWDAYNGNTETLSDYWMEVSRGTFHVTGQAVSVVLPYTVDEYKSMYGTGGFGHAIDDMCNYLSSLQGSVIHWPDYDKWSKNSLGEWKYNLPDGYADMLYICWRSQPDGIGMTQGQTPHPSCYHGDEHTVFNSGGQQVIVKNGDWPSEEHSTFMISPGHGGSGASYFMYAPLNEWAVISFSGHEHGHYLYAVRNFSWLGGHQLYSKVNNYNGMEEYLSPYELIRMGYHTTQKVNYAFNSNYTVNDWTSRDQNPYSQILEVPIGNENRNEFFLIANRQRESHYDRIMWGDKAKDDPYNPAADGMAKGIYIYHVFPGDVGSGYQWQVPIDQECADGLYDWVQDGYQTPDWSSTQQIEYFKKVNVNYNLNDLGGTPFTGANGRDGKSLTVYSPLYGSDMYNWFGLGKKEVPPGGGTLGWDRIETNLIADQPMWYSNPAPYEVWTNRDWKGDRWDGWSVGYNEVFSPYSSPSTRDWDNNNSGIFIYLESQNGTQAKLKIYKTGEGFNEEQILQFTPPSKPMNLKVEHCYNPSGTAYMYNKITWNHNLEPDMRREITPGVFIKRYKVYKVSSPNVTVLPNENSYSLIATVDANENLIPSYVDLSEPSGCHSYPDASCPPVCWSLHATRYRVQAVDLYESPSVKSDFASAFSFTVSTNGGTELSGDNPIGYINSAPTEFALLQNYPNPFNPSTDIKFELPQGSFVTVKIYNAIGEEVAILINNEWKHIGRYNVNFDASNLPSGIYFCSIFTGSFRDTKKMVLIK